MFIFIKLVFHDDYINNQRWIFTLAYSTNTQPTFQMCRFQFVLGPSYKYGWVVFYTLSIALCQPYTPLALNRFLLPAEDTTTTTTTTSHDHWNLKAAAATTSSNSSWMPSGALSPPLAQSFFLQWLAYFWSEFIWTAFFLNCPFRF